MSVLVDCFPRVERQSRRGYAHGQRRHQCQRNVPGKVDIGEMLHGLTPSKVERAPQRTGEYALPMTQQDPCRRKHQNRPFCEGFFRRGGCGPDNCRIFTIWSNPGLGGSGRVRYVFPEGLTVEASVRPMKDVPEAVGQFEEGDARGTSSESEF